MLILLLLLLLGSTTALKLLSVGDWGNPAIFSTIRGAMEECAQNASGILLLGDNFYDFGINSSTDPQIQSTYLDMFNTPNLNSTAHYVIAGNRDYFNPTGITYQLGMTWEFPSAYYSKLIQEDGVRVFIVFTDSWLLVGGGSSVYTKTIADLDQLEFIRRELNSTDARGADWRIVVGHYHLYSVVQDLPVLKKYLKPIFVEYGVDMYLFGHHHLFQVIDHHDGGPIYVGSGSGGRELNRQNRGFRYAGLQVMDATTHGFTSHVFTRTTFTTRFHTASGTITGDYIVGGGTRTTTTKVSSAVIIDLNVVVAVYSMLFM